MKQADGRQTHQRPRLRRRGASYGRSSFRRSSSGCLAMLAAMRRASSLIYLCISSFPSLFRLERWRELNHSSAGERQGSGGVMSKFERLLEAGSTELPDCRCAAEMNLTAIVPMDGGDTEIASFDAHTVVTSLD
jgi:hypothetical protein